jgi:hypothetical protein
MTAKLMVTAVRRDLHTVAESEPRCKPTISKHTYNLDLISDEGKGKTCGNVPNGSQLVSNRKPSARNINAFIKTNINPLILLFRAFLGFPKI